MMPGLGLLDVVVGGLDELQEDVLDVLADIAGFGERRRIGNGKGHVEHPGQGLGQERLAAAGRAEQEDVGLLQLDVTIGIAARLDPLVVVVDGDREDLLGPLLADYVVVEEVENLGGLGELVEAHLRRLGQLLFDDVVTEVYAFVADIDARTGDELLDLLLRFPAKRAFDQLARFAELGHVSPRCSGYAGGLQARRPARGS